MCPERNDVDGIVITMGTNAMEEVAFFTYLTVLAKKNIIFTGSMRPYNALGYEGDRNLYSSILLAAFESCNDFGLLICLNDLIFSAHNFMKLNPSFIDSSASSMMGPIGYVLGKKIKFFYRPIHSNIFFNLEKIIELPKVIVIYGSLDDSPILINCAIKEGVQGIISAGLGKGYQPKEITYALNNASEKGIFIVRCSRTMGVTHWDENTDKKYEFIPAGSLSPAKAKVLLQLALSHTKNRKDLCDIFNRF